MLATASQRYCFFSRVHKSFCEGQCKENWLRAACPLRFLLLARKHIPTIGPPSRPYVSLDTDALLTAQASTAGATVPPNNLRGIEAGTLETLNPSGAVCGLPLPTGAF